MPAHHVATDCKGGGHGDLPFRRECFQTKCCKAPLVGRASSCYRPQPVRADEFRNVHRLSMLFGLRVESLSRQFRSPHAHVLGRWRRLHIYPPAVLLAMSSDQNLLSYQRRWKPY